MLNSAAMALQLQNILNEKKKQCRELTKEQQEEDTVAGNYSGWCPVIFDDIMCWDHAAPGRTIFRRCPDYVPGFKPTEFAVRTCMADGTWGRHPSKNKSWTNFTACVDEPRQVDISYHAEQAERLTLMYTVGYSVSLGALVIAVFIMLYCRRLQCKSNTIHINLFLAFILRASLAFIRDKLFVSHLGLPQDVMFVNGSLKFIEHGLHWECRLIVVLFMYAISASQTWILMEGLYLYMLIHRTMVTERHGVKPYIIFGWALPVFFMIPWIIVKRFFENTFCWNLHDNVGYFWILKGPWMAIVMINFFFFLDIFRVLFMRVRSNHRHAGNSKYRKLAKFILVLIPLFGIMYIIIFIAFPDGHTDNEFNVVYLYIEMGYNSFQGFILALLFCFLNEDVHSELRRLWRRHRSRRQDSTYLKRSVAGSTWHPKSGDHSSSDHQDNTRNGASTRRNFASMNSGSMPAALNCSSAHSASFGSHRPFVCNRQSLTSLPGNRHSFVSLPVNRQGMSSLTGNPSERGMSGCRSDLTETGAGITSRDTLDQTSKADVCQYGKVLFLGRSCGSVKLDGRVVKGERVSENGNGGGGGGGVPAKIVFLDSDSSEETIPLSTSFELLTGRQTGDKASAGGQS